MYVCMYVCMYVSMYVSDWLQLQSSLGNSVNVSHGIVNQNYVVRSFRRYVLFILHSSIFQLCLSAFKIQMYVCMCLSLQHSGLQTLLYNKRSALWPRAKGSREGPGRKPRAQSRGERALPPSAYVFWAPGFPPGRSLDPLAVGHSALRLLYIKVCLKEVQQSKILQGLGRLH